MIGVLAAALTAVALIPLVARAAGGQPPGPAPRLAAFAPVATLPAVAGVAVAAAASWRLALLLSIPAIILLAWLLPPARPASRTRAQLPGQAADPGREACPLRVLTLNAHQSGADPSAVVHAIERHDVDVLAVQELIPDMVHGLADSGLDRLLPFRHLDPRPGAAGTGLWSRWPLTPLPPVPGLVRAAPRARIEPVDGRLVTLTAVHAMAPTRDHARRWQQELAAIRSALMNGDAQQVVAGDFNASRDHRPFRRLLAAGLLDCADAAQNRRWPGFTWPADRRLPPVMRLDHVLVSRDGATVLASQTVHVADSDHLGVLAVIGLAPTDRRPDGS